MHCVSPFHTQNKTYLLAAANFWTAAAVFFGPTFSAGLVVLRQPVRVSCAVVHTHEKMVAAARDYGANAEFVFPSMTSMAIGDELTKFATITTMQNTIDIHYHPREH